MIGITGIFDTGAQAGAEASEVGGRGSATVQCGVIRNNCLDCLDRLVADAAQLRGVDLRVASCLWRRRSVKLFLDDRLRAVTVKHDACYDLCGTASSEECSDRRAQKMMAVSSKLYPRTPMTGVFRRLKYNGKEICNELSCLHLAELSIYGE